MADFFHYVTLPFLWQGLLLTVEIATLSLVIAWPLAVVLATARVGKLRWLSYLIWPYVWAMRGTPILLQLIFWYNFLPVVGLRLSAPATAVLGLALNEIALAGEIIRGGIQSVPATQRAAAAALGMGNWLVLRRIVLPQALRAISPALANNAVIMIKNTSLASVISVAEITLRSQQIVAANFRYVPVFLAAGALYLVATSGVGLIQTRGESRINVEKRALRNAGAGPGPGDEGGPPGEPAPVFESVRAWAHYLEAELGSQVRSREDLLTRLAIADVCGPSADADPDKPFVVIDNVTKSFHGRPVLRGVSLTIDRGEVVAVVGPSGAGKTTLLYAIDHLLPTDGGRITVGGVDLGRPAPGHRRMSARSLARARAEARIGIVFQRFNLFDHMTVLQNIMEAPLRVYRMDPEQVRSDADSLLAWAGLLGYEQHFPHQLSGGQQQRVAIVRALACRPRLMLFDEPTSALDPQLVGDVLRLMRDLAEMGMTMMVVTHEMAFARESATEIVFMVDGRVVERGPSEALLGRHDEEPMRKG